MVEHTTENCGVLGPIPSLGTGSLLSANVADLPIVDGQIEINDVEPDFAGLEVAAERFDWWKNRVMRTWELIA